MNESIVQQVTRAQLSARFDANETAFLERQLTFVRAKVQELVYAEHKAMTFIPIASDIPASAETYAWEVLDEVGQAKVIARGSDDLPRVDVSAVERTGRTVLLGASYGWDVDEMAEAARLGKPLGERKARAARRAIDFQIDNILATGDTSSQNNLPFTGFINNADVEGLGILDGGTAWAEDMDPDDVLGTLNASVTEIVNESKEVWYPDTVLLSTREFMVASQLKVGTDNDKTVLKSFLENNPFVTSVAPWHRLGGAGATGKNRMITYKRDPDVLEGVVPALFAQLPPQARNLEFVVPCKARAGGVKVYHPLAIRYTDIAAS